MAVLARVPAEFAERLIAAGLRPAATGDEPAAITVVARDGDASAYPAAVEVEAGVGIEVPEHRIGDFARQLLVWMKQTDIQDIQIHGPRPNNTPRTRMMPFYNSAGQPSEISVAEMESLLRAEAGEGGGGTPGDPGAEVARQVGRLTVLADRAARTGNPWLRRWRQRRLFDRCLALESALIDRLAQDDPRIAEALFTVAGLSLDLAWEGENWFAATNKGRKMAAAILQLDEAVDDSVPHAEAIRTRLIAQMQDRPDRIACAGHWAGDAAGAVGVVEMLTSLYLGEHMISRAIRQLNEDGIAGDGAVGGDGSAGDSDGRSGDGRSGDGGGRSRSGSGRGSGSEGGGDDGDGAVGALDQLIETSDAIASLRRGYQSAIPTSREELLAADRRQLWEEHRILAASDLAVPYLGFTAETAPLAAGERTGRTLLYLAAGGPEAGTAIRVRAVAPPGPLAESVALPDFHREALTEWVEQIRLLNSGEPADVARLLGGVADAVWRPVLERWPDLVGSATALVPIGAAASLPFYTALVRQDDRGRVPACALMNLTIAPSARSLLLASTWPAAPRRVLVAYDRDERGGAPIHLTAKEARMVAEVHGVVPMDAGALGEPVGTGAPAALTDAGELGEPVDTGELGQRVDAGELGDPVDDGSLGVPMDTGGLGQRVDAGELGALWLSGGGGYSSDQPADQQADQVSGHSPEQRIVAAVGAATVLHLACHGNLLADRPLDSWLQLGGRIRLSDLLSTNLQAGALVVLTACSIGGIGSLQPAEQLGFPAALLAKGARGVVGALWPTRDTTATARLIRDFHAGLACEREPSMVALGAAIGRAHARGVGPEIWGPVTQFGA